MTADTHATTSHEVAQLLVDVIHLEMAPRDVQLDEPLFGDGLGLDSIDALEIALAISRTYGFELKSDEARAHHVFESRRSLTRYIDAHRIR